MVCLPGLQKKHVRGRVEFKDVSLRAEMADSAAIDACDQILKWVVEPGSIHSGGEILFVQKEGCTSWLEAYEMR